MAARRGFDPATMSSRAFYKLLTAVVVPRPIAWVSTRSKAGVDNLAPHSFYSISCVEPPIVQFTSVGVKDTLRNVQDTGEFVVSLAAESLYEQINDTGTNFPADVGEFDAAAVPSEPSELVAPPRVAASPVAVECVLHATLSLGNCTVVMGRVVHIAIDSAALDGDHPRIEALRPLARLGREEWSTLGDVRSISRIRYDDWNGPSTLG